MEDRRGKDNKMPREMWEVVETKVGEVRVAEAKERKGRKETGGKGRKTEEKAEERKNNRCKKDSKRVGDL